MELYKKSAAELSALLRSKEVTACEILDDTLARIDAVEPKVDAFLSVTADTARAKAKEVDEKIARGETLGVLAGIPVGIKDNICTKGLKTTCASRMLENFVPPYNATVVEKLAAADAVNPRQAEHGRICHGRFVRKFLFQAHEKPLGYHSCAGRLIRRKRGQCGCVRGAAFPRLRYRRFHPLPSRFVRYRGPQAYIRRGIALRPRSVCFIAGHRSGRSAVQWTMWRCCSAPSAAETRLMTRPARNMLSRA